MRFNRVKQIFATFLQNIFMTRDVEGLNLEKFGDFRIRGRVRESLIVSSLLPHLFIPPKLPTTTLISLQHSSCASLNHFTGSNCLFAAFWACLAISFIKIKGSNTYYYKNKYNIHTHFNQQSQPESNRRFQIEDLVY